MALKMELARACYKNKKLTERFLAQRPADRCKLVKPDQIRCQNRIIVFGFLDDADVFSVYASKNEAHTSLL